MLVWHSPVLACWGGQPPSAVDCLSLTRSHDDSHVTGYEFTHTVTMRYAFGFSGCSMGSHTVTTIHT